MFFYWLFIIIWCIAGGMFCIIWLDTHGKEPKQMNKKQKRLFWLLSGPAAWVIYNIGRPVVNYISDLFIAAGEFMNREGE